MTFKEKFEKISKKLFKADITKFDEAFAIQITMSDEDCGGTFFVAYSDGTYRIEPYDYVDNTINIFVDSATLEKIIDKKLTVEAAVYGALLSYNGNLGHLTALFEAIEKKKITRKKTITVKKTAKSTETKKEASEKTEDIKKAAKPKKPSEGKTIKKK